ncbi:Protein binding protein [Echinococcus multilocularis]|uniref:Protein binding protein n=1 Tax=Echinococcus multilocularis TaxID=6211 RepID=A0A0S4MLU6_ECHMU|nr:Protein binding protein [Echinococcus multilocularis]
MVVAFLLFGSNASRFVANCALESVFYNVLCSSIPIASSQPALLSSSLRVFVFAATCKLMCLQMQCVRRLQNRNIVIIASVLVTTAVVHTEVVRVN